SCPMPPLASPPPPPHHHKKSEGRNALAPIQKARAGMPTLPLILHLFELRALGDLLLDVTRHLFVVAELAGVAAAALRQAAKAGGVAVEFGQRDLGTDDLRGPLRVHPHDPPAT